MTLKATSYVRANFVADTPWETAVLASFERHLRRKLLALPHGGEVLVDFEKAVKLEHGDCLVLEDGRLVEIVAGEEDLMEIIARDALHLATLAWHIGNRHLEAQIETARILIRRDPVIAHMLEHQGAAVREVREPFSPEHGAYHAHGPGQPHAH